MKTAEEIVNKAKEHSRWANNFDMRENAYLEGVKYGAVEGLSEAAQFKNEWVSVDDRLPANRSYVLAYTTNGGYTSTCEYKHGCWFNGLEQLNFVTHWQPLPHPHLTK